MTYIDPVSQWRTESALKPWIGIHGRVVSVTGDSLSGFHVLAETKNGRITLPVLSPVSAVQSGDSIQIWMGQQSVMPDGRVVHGLVAHMAS